MLTLVEREIRHILSKKTAERREATRRVLEDRLGKKKAS